MRDKNRDQPKRDHVNNQFSLAGNVHRRLDYPHSNSTSCYLDPNILSNNVNNQYDNKNHSDVMVNNKCQSNEIQFNPKIPGICSNIPFLSDFECSNQLPPNGINLSCPYVIDYHYGMELTPGTFVNLPISYNQVNNNVISLPVMPTNVNDANGAVGVIGLAVDSNTVVPLNNQFPVLNLNASPHKTYINQHLNELPPIHHNPATNVYIDPNDNTHFNIDKNSSHRVAISRPLPPLQITIDDSKIGNYPINNNEGNHKPFPCQPSNITSNVIIAKNDQSNIPSQPVAKRYDCVYCTFSFKSENELNEHLLMHTVNRTDNNRGSTVNEIPPLAPSLSHQSGDVNNKQNHCKDCGHLLSGLNLCNNNSNNKDYERLTRDKILIDVCENCGKEYQRLSEFNESVSSLFCHNPLIKEFKSDNFQPSNNPHNERFYCSRCNKSYKHNRDLRKHEKIVHGLERPMLNKSTRNQRFNINKPNNQLNSSINFNYSTNYHDNYANIDDDLYINKKSPNKIMNNSNQLESVLNDTYNRFVCDKCSKSFRGPFELRRHVLTVHENKKPFKCNICGKHFRDTYEIKRHGFSQHKNFLDKITFGESATTIENLAIDEISQLALQYNNKGNSITNQHGMNDNITELNSGQCLPINTASMEINENNIISDDRSATKNLFKSSEGLSAPNISTLNNNNNNNNNNFSDNDQRLNVTQNTIGEFYCGICNRNFRGSNEFKRHYSVVHEKRYRYKCIHCGKLWRDQYDLKRHCRRGHFYGREIDKDFIRQCLLANINANEIGLQSTDFSHADSNNIIDSVISNDNSQCPNTNVGLLFNSSSNSVDENTNLINQTPIFAINELVGKTVLKENSKFHLHAYDDNQSGYNFFDNHSHSMMEELPMMVSMIDHLHPNLNEVKSESSKNTHNSS